MKLTEAENIANVKYKVLTIAEEVARKAKKFAGSVITEDVATAQDNINSLAIYLGTAAGRLSYLRGTFENAILASKGELTQFGGKRVGDKNESN